MELNKEQKKFKQELIELFSSPDMKTLNRRVKQVDKDFDPREIYRKLGEKLILTPNLPQNLGGRNLGFVSIGILAEELTNHGIPESLFVLSNLIVTNLIYLYGTKNNQLKFVRDLSTGKKFGVVLFSEPGVRSDLSTLRTSSVNYGDKFVVTGRKVYI